MVWEQRSSTIVMLTRLEERARIKCDQYWPTRGTECYGVMSVTLTDTQELATYCIRTFQLQRVSSMNVSIPSALHINLHVVILIFSQNKWSGSNLNHFEPKIFPKGYIETIPMNVTKNCFSLFLHTKKLHNYKNRRYVNWKHETITTTH